MDTKIFGCKVNKYYINKWLNHLQKNNTDTQDKVLMASCVVTDRAKTKWIKEIIKIIKSGKQVLLTGCGSIDRGDVWEEEKFFDIYKELVPYKNDITLLPEDPDKSSDFADNNIYTKKFIVIQNGCDTHCTFCLSVVKRGKSYSIPTEKIIKEISNFEKSGGKEIVLTGINLAAYGASNTRKSSESKFNELLKNILNKTSISRIRISSLGPEFLNDEFFDIIKNPRFMRHLHFSIQSFSDDVLKMMNRNYIMDTLKYILTKTKEISPNISIGADIIVGFPGETDEDFEQTYDAIKEFGINKLHVFPFSGHNKYETIPASRLPNQVNKNIIKQREKKLIELGDRIREQFIDSQIGQKYEILIEEKRNNRQIGWTSNYIQVTLTGDYKRGDIYEVIVDKGNCS